MRRKRLKHIAQNLCQMFCGWRQIFSKPQLVQLGSGRLQIDILRRSCRFNDAEITPLPIAAELAHWLDEDLARNAIPKEALTVVIVEADIELEIVPWEPVPGSSFFVKGEPVRPGPMHRCAVRCSSLVQTPDAEYRAEYHDTERWPVGWPAA